jgi:excisionase family DNA binding protein
VVLMEEEALRRLVREVSQAPVGLLTVKEAATYLGMTEAALRRSAQRDVVPSTKLPTGRVRFERAALDAWARSAS